jgi:hypothetical protein
MNSVRWAHTATLLPNGNVLLAGGFNGSGVATSADLYDPWAATFTAVAWPTARAVHSATLLGNGSVLIAGGHVGASQVASTEIFNPATNTFTPYNSMNVAREGHFANLLPTGDVLLSGGYNTTNGALSTAELFVAASGNFVLKTMASPYTDHSATLTAGGQVFISGTISIVSIYDPIAGSFSTLVAWPIPRFDSLTVLLPNGKVLITGGEDFIDVTASSSLISPAK